MKSVFLKIIFTVIISSLALTIAWYILREHEPGRTRAAYWWNTTLNLTSQQIKCMEKTGINKLYIHFFDVAMKDGKPRPIALVRIQSSLPASVVIVPVVYITQECIQSLQKNQVNHLAKNIIKMVIQLADYRHIRWDELQLDCDWTAASKEIYFSLLRQIHASIPDKPISATIRLHQLKYPEKAGIPPVSRGMLMTYNIGQLNNVHELNSIYTEKVAEAYAKVSKTYPLPLDIALPYFHWGVHFRYGRIISLSNDIQASDLDTNAFKRLDDHVYICKSSGFYHMEYFDSLDILRLEQGEENECLSAVKLFHTFAEPTGSVSLYHFNTFSNDSSSYSKINHIYQAAHCR